MQSVEAKAKLDAQSLDAPARRYIICPMTKSKMRRAEELCRKCEYQYTCEAWKGGKGDG